MERFGETRKRNGQDESGTGDKKTTTQNWLAFFEKDLNKIANLDQKTCKEKILKGKFGKVSITSS